MGKYVGRKAHTHLRGHTHIPNRRYCQEADGCVEGLGQKCKVKPWEHYLAFLILHLLLHSSLTFPLPPFSWSNYNVAYLHLVTNNPHSSFPTLLFSLCFCHLLCPVRLSLSWFITSDRGRREGTAEESYLQREKVDNKEGGGRWKPSTPNKAGEKAVRSEQRSVVAALNYGARASFIRIPSPPCSLSGGY